MKIFHDLNEKCHVLTGKGTVLGINNDIGKSPLSPLCQRGVIPPFGKGRVGGILRKNATLL